MSELPTATTSGDGRRGTGASSPYRDAGTDFLRNEVSATTQEEIDIASAELLPGRLEDLAEAPIPCTGEGAHLQAITLPDGLVVVQLGDLVHRGPDSAGVIALVDRFLRGPHHDRWFQLIGNHERPYLFDPPSLDRPSAIRRELDERSGDTVRAWWADGLAQAATAITPDWEQVALPRRMRSVRPAGDILVTHAGLTHGAWLAVGQPATAAAAAAAINADARGPTTVTLREGRMTTGTTELAAGPLWAEAGGELLTSWDGTTDAPHLNQIHGHTSVRGWSQERWWPGADVIVNRGDVIADPATRRELARIGSRLIWGIDPGHNHTPAPMWQPLVIPLEGARPSPRGLKAVNRHPAWHRFRRPS